MAIKVPNYYCKTNKKLFQLASCRTLESLLRKGLLKCFKVAAKKTLIETFARTAGKFFEC